jgi:hypothetical protein
MTTIPLPDCFFRTIGIYCERVKTTKRGGYCVVLLKYDKCPEGHRIFPDCSHRCGTSGTLCDHPEKVRRNEYGAFHNCLQHRYLELCPDGHRIVLRIGNTGSLFPRRSTFPSNCYHDCRLCRHGPESADSCASSTTVAEVVCDGFTPTDLVNPPGVVLC